MTSQDNRIISLLSNTNKRVVMVTLPYNRTSEWAVIIKMQEYVLSGGDIVRLKKFIEHKHLELDPLQRAPILADAVHRIIEGRLPSFPDQVKKEVCHELLKKNRDTLVIQADDVLKHCVSLDLSKEDILSPLAEWVCNRSDILVEEDMVRVILHRWYQAQLSTVSFQALEREWDQQDERVCIEIAVTSEAVVPVVPYWQREGFNARRYITMACLFAAVLLSILMVQRNRQPSAPATIADTSNIPLPIINNGNQLLDAGIPAELKYVSIDVKRLQQFLRDRNSMLAEEPYLSEIVGAAKKYDIHPLLLFAITGQEQGFVPKDHKNVKEIANNPFNVFGSWESYNTTIVRSASIAAKTVANISSRRPGGSPPIQWLNRTYAEDTNWWKGVTWFFDTLKREVEGESLE